MIPKKVKQMAEYLDTVVPDDKIDIVQSGLSQLILTQFMYGLVAGISICCLIGIVFFVVGGCTL